MLRSVFVVAGLCLTALPGAAQQLPLRHFNTADGLAHNVVTVIHEDAAGYLWIGTLEGVSRFDGRTFVTHGRREGLPAAPVTAFDETPDGRVWVATTPTGLWEFIDTPRTAESTTPLFRRAGVSEDRAAQRVYGVAETAGVVWAATDGGLFRVRGGRMERVLAASSAEYGTGRFIDRRGTIWMGLRNRLLRVGADATVEFELPASPRGVNDIAGIAEPGPGALAVAGLFDLYQRHSPSVPFSRIALPLDRTEQIQAVVATPGALWIGTTRGLLRMTGSRIVRYTRAHGMPAPVTALANTTAGLWIGSTDGLRLLVNDSGAVVDLPDRDGPVLSATPLPAGVVATTSGSIFVVNDTQDSSSARVAGRDAVGSRLIRGPLGTWWLGTHSGIYVSRAPLPGLAGAVRLGAAHGVRTDTALFHDESQSTSGMHMDRNGAVWLATREDIFYKCTIARDAPACVEVPRTGVSWRRRPVAVTSDGAGTVWVASSSGLMRHAGGHSEPVRTIEPEEGRLELAPAIFVDSRGWLWVGTHHDGVLLSRSPLSPTPRFENVGPGQGLSSGAVFAFLESAGGDVYAATGRGVDRITASAGALIVRPVDLGFDTGEVHGLSRAPDGVVWIAAATGLLRYGALPDRAGRPPRVYLQRLTIRGREWPLPGRGTSSLGPLTLRAGDDDVRVEFAAPLLTGRSLQFQYRFDDEGPWTPPSDDRAFTFARLRPGAYALQVRAVAAGGPSEPALLRFRLPAPMWQRWWFRGAAALAIAGLAAAWHRSRITRALALERIRTQIASDLHDDVGSRLAEIAIVSELGVRETRDGTRDRFTHVASTARDVRQAISDVVWAIDPRCDHLSDLAARIRVAADALLDPAVDVVVTAPPRALMERIPLSPEQRRQILLIAREALVNIQKHAGATRVEIGIAVDAQSLQLVVDDDGRGLAAASASQGLGLASMRRRAERLGGVFAAGPAPAGGARIRADIPLGKGHGFFQRRRMRM